MIQECRQRIIDILPEKNTQLKAEKLAQLLAEAYRIDPHQFSDMWNKILTGQNKTGMKFYLVSVYLRMEAQFGETAAAEMLSYDHHRIWDLMKYSSSGINMVNRVFNIIYSQILKGEFADAWDTTQEAFNYGTNRYDMLKEVVKKIEAKLDCSDRKKVAEFCDYLLHEVDLDDKMRKPLCFLRCLARKEKCNTKDEALECLDYALYSGRKAARILFYNRKLFNTDEIISQVEWCCEKAAPEVWCFYSYDLSEEIADWIRPYIACSDKAIDLMIRNDCYLYLDKILPEMIKSRDYEGLKRHLVMIMNYGMTHRIKELMSEAGSFIPEPTIEEKKTVEFTEDGKMVCTFVRPSFVFVKHAVNLDGSSFISEEHATWFLNIVEEVLNSEKIERDCQHIRDQLKQIRNPKPRYNTFTVVIDFDAKMIAYAEMFFGMKITHPSQELLNNVDWALDAIDRKEKGLCLDPPNKECVYFVDNILNDDEHYDDIEKGAELLSDLRNRVVAKLGNDDKD